MKKILSLLLISSLLLMTGCETVVINDNTSTPPTIQNEIENPNITEDITVSGMDVKSASKLLDSMFDNKNIMISPLSIYMALGMTANGASENTLKEMEDFLGMDIESFNKLCEGIINVPTESESLKISNGIWVKDDKNINLNKNFEKTIKDFYNGKISLAKMDSSTVKEINDYVNKNTNKMIPEIISDISPETASILINALYFECLWADQYEEYQVQDGQFNGKDVKMMNSNENTYMENDKAIAFEKPYKDRKYSFIGILPKEEGEFTLEGLNIKSLLDSKTNKYEVNTKLPKFTFEYSTQLNDVLKAAGIKDAFDIGSADFSKMFDSPYSFFISEVLHKTKIEVSETGTKAAAVTAVIMECGAAIQQKEIKEVYLDRPFAFIIMDNENNIPVFIGKVLEI